jgi:choline-glycine betaine transporter
MSGLHAGVKFLSQLALGLGMVLTMLVFIMDDSKFLLNLIVQEVGYYFQWSIFRKLSAQTLPPLLPTATF